MFSSLYNKNTEKLLKKKNKKKKIKKKKTNKKKTRDKKKNERKGRENKMKKMYKLTTPAIATYSLGTWYAIGVFEIEYTNDKMKIMRMKL